MKPNQFNFFSEWSQSIKAVRSKPKVVDAMNGVARQWLEIAEMKFTDHREHDAIQAQLEFDLDLMTFAVMHWNFHWLRGVFENGGWEMTKLSLAIAETLYPDEAWDILENYDFFLVTNSERTLVFDFANFDKISAGASLALAKDTLYSPSESERLEYTNLLKIRCAKTTRALSLVKHHIESSH